MADDTSARDWLVCARTQALLTQLDGVLRAAVDAGDLQLRIMALHLIEKGGKRLRPSLLILSASYGAYDRNDVLRSAAALELMHVASLYHDDVMDRAALRRSGPSTNARWGNALATFAGTYLFARASALLATVGQAPNELASHASVDLCTGQLREVESAFDLDLDETRHLSILEQKTATLFELPCRLGAQLSDAAFEDALAAFGRNLGLAFQLADDALDLTAETDQIGKTAGNDLVEGVHTLPVLRALRDGPAREPLRALLGQVRLTTEDVTAALRLVRESGAIEEVLDLAREVAGRARDATDALPDGPATESLRRLAEYAVTRTY